jgi:CRISPR-associated endonuclease/helicase Cas3
MKKLLANSKGQSLSSHLAGVAILSQQLFLKSNFKESIKAHSFPDSGLESNWNYESMSKNCFLAGILHDIGKIDPKFQEYISSTKHTEEPEDGYHVETTKKVKKEEVSFHDEHPYHHEISWAILQNLTKTHEEVEYAVYYHHASRFNLENFSNLTQIVDKTTENKEELIKVAIEVLKESFGKAGMDFGLSYIDNQSMTVIPAHKKIKNVTFEKKKVVKAGKYDYSFNVKANIVRTMLITADRIVSSMSSEELEEFLVTKELNRASDDRDFLDFSECINSFPNNDRTNTQKETVKKGIKSIEEDGIVVYSAPAGSGKTLMSLIHVTEVKTKQIFYITPRRTIADGLFKELTSNNYPHNCSVEIITGENREKRQKGKANLIHTDNYELMSSDIVITTIDQMISLFSSHKKTDSLFKMLNATFIFDEFHEIKNIANMYYAFGEILYTKLLMNDSNVVLLSATPNPFYLQRYGIDKKSIIEMKSFNEELYNIKLVDVLNVRNKETKEDLYDCKIQEEAQKLPYGHAFILDSIDRIHQAFLANQNENTHIAHSNMSIKDRKKQLDGLFERWGKESTTGKVHRLYSSVLIKASLNLSFRGISLTLSSPEDILQVVGRINRFAEKYTGELTVYVPVDKNGKVDAGGFKYLENADFSKNSATLFIEFLKGKKLEGITLTEFYGYYYEFYRENKGSGLIDEDYKAIELKAQTFVLDRGLCDKKFEGKVDKKIKTQRTNLRGSGVYVNAMVIRDGEDCGYLYDPKQAVNSQSEDLMTMSLDTPGNYETIARFTKELHKVGGFEFMGLGKRAWKYVEKNYQYKFRKSNSPCYLSFCKSEENINKEDCADKQSFYVYNQGVCLGLVKRSTYEKFLGKING